MKDNKTAGYFRLGIDPGLKRSGTALMENGIYTRLQMMNFMQLTEFIKRRPKDLIVSIENVLCKDATFDRGFDQKRMRKIAQNVGMVKGAYSIMIEMLEYYDCPYISINPLVGVLKNQTKNNPDVFNRLTGWSGRSNEHTRDAAMLLYEYRRR